MADNLSYLQDTTEPQQQEQDMSSRYEAPSTAPSSPSKTATDAAPGSLPQHNNTDSVIDVDLPENTNIELNNLGPHRTATTNQNDDKQQQNLEQTSKDLGTNICPGSDNSGQSFDLSNTQLESGRRTTVGNIIAINTPKSKDIESEEDRPSNDLLFKIDDIPPWYLSILLGFQHYLTMVGSTITIPFIITPVLCIQSNDPARGYILSTLLCISGVATLMQTIVGVRLPIIQGGSFSFFAPIIAILSTQFPACESINFGNLTEWDQQEEWQIRMREIQGSIIMSSFFMILVGFTGIIGLVVSFITPLAIAPTITLVGLSLFNVASDKAATHWPIAILTMLLMAVFSQYLKNTPVPCVYYSKAKGFTVMWIKLFGLFPVLLAILSSWALCAILTSAGALSEDSAARTDTATELLSKSPWVRFPYPGQWGLPTVSVSSVFAMMAGVMASIVESVGDYYACAKLAGAPPPPRGAINRGIGIEGLGCLLSGIWGSGTGTISYSENIGAIGLTKIGSRRVIQYGAVIMIVCGCLGKFAALFVSIPDPVVGGIFCVMFAMITGVGLSALHDVDLNSSRNLFVLGFPIFFGLALPKWLEGNAEFNEWAKTSAGPQIVAVLLKTSMFVGGFLGILLDNTVPGTAKERGIAQRDLDMAAADHLQTSDQDTAYDLPFGMAYIRRTPIFKKIPFSPTFQGFNWKKNK